MDGKRSEDATVGVLALQGAFAKHIEMLRDLDVDAIEVKGIEALQRCDALIIPGGESTTIAKNITHLSMWDPLQKFAQKNPLLGTCAGLILMANEVAGSYDYPTLSLLDITVSRNAYGRQPNSFTFETQLLEQSIEAIFIRAPRIERWGPKVKILADLDEKPIAVQQGRHLAATFHPELTKSLALHNYFLSLL